MGNIRGYSSRSGLNLEREMLLQDQKSFWLTKKKAQMRISEYVPISGLPNLPNDKPACLTYRNLTGSLDFLNSDGM